MDRPCEHIRALIDYLRTHGLAVWAEHQEWVNVSCQACHEAGRGSVWEGILAALDEEQP